MSLQCRLVGGVLKTKIDLDFLSVFFFLAKPAFSPASLQKRACVCFCDRRLKKINARSACGAKQIPSFKKMKRLRGCGVAGFVFLKKSLGTSLQKITGGASSERSPKDI